MDASANRLVTLDVIIKDNNDNISLERRFHAGLINFGQTIEGIKDSIGFICLSKQIPSFIIQTVEVKATSGDYKSLHANFDFHAFFDIEEKKKRGSLKPHIIRVLGVTDVDDAGTGSPADDLKMEESSESVSKRPASPQRLKKDRRSTSASHCRRQSQANKRSISRPRNEPENTTRNQSPSRSKPNVETECKQQEKPVDTQIRSCATAPIRPRKLAPDCDGASNAPASPSRIQRPTARARPASPFKLSKQTPGKLHTAITIAQEEPQVARTLESKVSLEAVECKKEKDEDIDDKSSDDLSVSSGTSGTSENLHLSVSSRKRAPSPSKQSASDLERMTPRVETQQTWEGTLRSGRANKPESLTKSAKASKLQTSCTKEKNDDFSSLIGSQSRRNAPLHCGKDGEARPSYGTLYELFETLKTAMNVDDEEVQWIAASKGSNGFEYAEEKEKNAEDNYYRWTWEQEARQYAIRRLNNPSLTLTLENIRKLHDDWQEISRIRVMSISEYDGDANPQQVQKSRMEELEASIQVAQQKLLVFAQEEEVKDFPEETEIGDLLKKVTTAEVTKSGRRAVIAQRKIEENVQSLKEFATKCQSRIDNFVATMEKWRERKERLACYDEEMAKRERKWIDTHDERNNSALEKMRSLIPVNVSALSQKELQQEFQQAGVFCPKALSTYIKDTKILHWLVSHPNDIQSCNFLTGEHAHSFTQLDKYDIVEMRAIAAIIPERFDLDRDGKKKEWRRSFFARILGMSQQELGETVRGGYDGVLRKRKDIALPSLDKEKQRRAVYYYPSKDSMADVARKFDSIERRLAAKQNELNTCQTDLAASRKDFNDLVMDMRDASIKNSSISDELANIKSSQQDRVRELERLALTLNTEIRSLRNAIDNRTISREEVEAEIQELEKIDRLRLSDASAISPQEVPGPFDSIPVISRTAKSSVRKLSAEEERKQRLLELQTSIPKSAKSLEATSTDTFLQEDGNAIKKTLLSCFDAAAFQSNISLSRGQSGASCRQIGKISASDELIRVLERNFSERSISSTPLLVRKPSLCSTPLAPAIADMKSPSKLQPKSRLVQQLIQRKLTERSASLNGEENGGNTPAGKNLLGSALKAAEMLPMKRPAMGGLSFLDELRRKSKATE